MRDGERNVIIALGALLGMIMVVCVLLILRGRKEGGRTATLPEVYEIEPTPAGLSVPKILIAWELGKDTQRDPATGGMVEADLKRYHAWIWAMVEMAKVPRNTFSAIEFVPPDRSLLPFAPAADRGKRCLGGGREG